MLSPGAKGVARRGELDAAVGALDGDDDHAGPVADVGVAERPARQRAVRDGSGCPPSRWPGSNAW